MGMVDEWSKTSLNKKKKKRDEIYGERENIEWKAMILGEMEWKWRRNEGGLNVLAMKGLERENRGRKRETWGWRWIVRNMGGYRSQKPRWRP